MNTDFRADHIIKAKTTMELSSKEETV